MNENLEYLLFFDLDAKYFWRLYFGHAAQSHLSSNRTDDMFDVLALGDFSWSIIGFPTSNSQYSFNL